MTKTSQAKAYQDFMQEIHEKYKHTTCKGESTQRK